MPEQAAASGKLVKLSKNGKRIGRPSTAIPQQKADEVLAWIREGKTLRDWCRLDGNPTYAAVYDWMEKDKSFATRFAQAREVGHDVIAQECLAIADDAQNDWMTRKRGKQVDRECVERSKLRVDTRLKLLARWNPQKYGDAVRLNHSGTISLEALVSGAQAEREPKQIEAETDEASE